MAGLPTGSGTGGGRRRRRGRDRGGAARAAWRERLGGGGRGRGRGGGHEEEGIGVRDGALRADGDAARRGEGECGAGGVGAEPGVVPPLAVGCVPWVCGEGEIAHHPKLNNEAASCVTFIIGHRLWNAAIVMAEMVDSAEVDVRGLDCLELGAGAALPSLLAALVRLNDDHDQSTDRPANRLKYRVYGLPTLYLHHTPLGHPTRRRTAPAGRWRRTTPARSTGCWWTRSS